MKRAMNQLLILLMNWISLKIKPAPAVVPGRSPKNKYFGEPRPAQTNNLGEARQMTSVIWRQIFCQKFDGRPPMRHKTRFFLILLMAVFVFPNTNVFAGSHEKGNCDWKDKNKVIKDKHPFAYGLDDRLFYESGVYLQLRDELALSEEQFKKIKDIKSTLKKELILKKAEISAVKVDIHSELEKDQMDVEAMRAYLGKKHDLEAQYSSNLVKHYDELRSVLNEEQKVKLDAMYKSETKICPYSDRGKNS